MEGSLEKAKGPPKKTIGVVIQEVTNNKSTGEVYEEQDDTLEVATALRPPWT